MEYINQIPESLVRILLLGTVSLVIFGGGLIWRMLRNDITSERDKIKTAIEQSSDQNKIVLKELRLIAMKLEANEYGLSKTFGEKSKIYEDAKREKMEELLRNSAYVGQ